MLKNRVIRILVDRDSNPPKKEIRRARHRITKCGSYTENTTQTPVCLEFKVMHKDKENKKLLKLNDMFLKACCLQLKDKSWG